MEWLLIIFTIVVITVFVILKSKIGESVGGASYVQKPHLLSPAERSFYSVLEQAIGSDYKLHTKVRVADVLEPAKGMDRSRWQSAFNRISAKHFDYILCNPDSLKVELAIELNDSSHNSKKRRIRDDFLAGACEAASLKLLSFDAKRAYSIAQIREQIAGGT